jgi:hypothetical protein
VPEYQVIHGQGTSHFPVDDVNRAISSHWIQLYGKLKKKSASIYPQPGFSAGSTI